MLNPDARPDGWRAHVLAAEIGPGVYRAHIQMFLTEENPGLIYTVNLVQDPAINDQAAYAHLYAIPHTRHSLCLAGHDMCL